MKRFIACLAAATVLGQGCAASTRITSQPSGAKLYVDGMPVGQTPYRHRDRKIVGSKTTIRLEKPGYQTLNTSFSRDEGVHVGALIGGLFLFPVFLWVTDYEPTHDYVLTPDNGQAPAATPPVAAPAAPTPAEPAAGAPAPPAATPAAPSSPSRSKADRLRELDSLKEQKLITEVEYHKQRQKILDER